MRPPSRELRSEGYDRHKLSSCERGRADGDGSAWRREIRMRWREKLRRKEAPAKQVNRADDEVRERLLREGVLTREQLEEAREYESLDEWVKATLPGWKPDNPIAVRDEEQAWEHTLKSFQGHLSQLSDCQAAARGDKRPFRQNVEAGVEEYKGSTLMRHILRCPYCGMTHTFYYRKADLYISLD
jgi:hypothetical protein